MQPMDPVTCLKGVGPKTAQKLKKLQIETVGDLLRHLPVRVRDLRRPIPLSQLEEGREALVSGTVTAPPRWISRKGKFSVFSFEVADGTGVLMISMFNVPFLMDRFTAGRKFLFCGKAKRFGGRLQMDNPLSYDAGHAPGMVADYPLCEGVTHKLLRQLAAQAVRETYVEDEFSLQLREYADLLPRGREFAWAHCPSSPEEEQAARRSMIRRELLVFARMLALMDQ
ncbi:MAG: hypothetical protein IJP03_00625, partial [Christensenellaceae bacterium]|nr:hypothetical protein [Christensenellaceae bacterium]